MLIKTIVFRPINDEPALQLFCIVQYVGGLTQCQRDRLPVHVKRMFVEMNVDNHQQRVRCLLKQIFDRYTSMHPDERTSIEPLRHLLTRMFQFQSDQRISLQSSIEHSFFVSMNNTRCSHVSMARRRTSSVRIDDLVRLCTRQHLDRCRWMLSLKERCQLTLIVHIDDFTRSTNQFERYGVNRALESELRQLANFLAG
jgi:hypothetical protein